MPGRHARFDRSRLLIRPLAERVHDLHLDSCLQPAESPLPFVHPDLSRLAERIIGAQAAGSARVLMMGAHVVKAGASRVVIDLMNRGFVDHVAMNGAGAIHDFELARIGATTERVANYIRTGEFGLWKETGELNDWIAEAGSMGLRLGEHVGRRLAESAWPHLESSILAAGYRLRIPITVHVGIGYDILHEHPNCDGAALGAASYTDFLIFAATVERLEHGVVLNFGSAIMAPEVYLKSLAMARNVARQEGRLTLSYGIRYELANGQPSATGKTAMFVPSVGKVVVFSDSYPNGTVPILRDTFKPPLAKDVGLSNDVWALIGQDHNNFAPRLGLAYRVRRGTVVRGAFGMYYNGVGTGTLAGGLYSNIPFSVAQTFEQPSGPVPAFTMSNPFSASSTIPANPTASFLARTVTPYTLQWNFTVEQELPQAMGLRLSYVGAHNVKQSAAHVGGAGVSTNPDLHGVTPAPGATQPRRPYQPYSTISVNNPPIFQSSLNTLQAGLQKRFSKGWLLNAEYQYVRVLGTEGFLDNLKWGDSRGNMNGIRNHVLVVSYSYELPFSRDKALWRGARGVANALVSGWTFSGISTFMTGAPFSAACSTSVQGSVCGRPDVLPGASLYPASQTIDQWLNPSAFKMSPDYTYGNSGYNMLWGPGYQNWDISLAKNTRIGEQVNLQLRLDTFSTFNHPQFSNPNSTITNPATVGKITSAGGSRTMQIGARLQF